MSNEKWKMLFTVPLSQYSTYRLPEECIASDRVADSRGLARIQSHQVSPDSLPNAVAGEHYRQTSIRILQIAFPGQRGLQLAGFDRTPRRQSCFPTVGNENIDRIPRVSIFQQFLRFALAAKRATSKKANKRADCRPDLFLCGFHSWCRRQSPDHRNSSRERCAPMGGHPLLPWPASSRSHPVPARRPAIPRTTFQIAESDFGQLWLLSEQVGFRP